MSSSSLKFSHLLSGLLRLPLRPHSFQPLQLIQNAATRLVFNLPRPSHVIPLIQSLHWLLVLNTKSCCWQTELQKGSTYAHHPAPVQVYTQQPALLFCNHWPFSLPLRFIPRLAVVPSCCLLTSSTSPSLHCNFFSSILSMFIS